MTPIKPVHTDKMSKDTCTPLTKNSQTTKDHGLVNQDNTLKSVERKPEQEINTGLVYKGSLLETVNKPMIDPSSSSTFLIQKRICE